MSVTLREERLQILKMLEEGKVTSEEAARLLEALETGALRPDSPGRKNRFLRVRVFEGGKNKVNVNLPLELARVALRFVPKDALNVQGGTIDLDEIVQAIEEGAQGKIVEVDDDDTRVEVVVE